RDRSLRPSCGSQNVHCTRAPSNPSSRSNRARRIHRVRAGRATTQLTAIQQATFIICAVGEFTYTDALGPFQRATSAAIPLTVASVLPTLNIEKSTLSTSFTTGG